MINLSEIMNMWKAMRDEKRKQEIYDYAIAQRSKNSINERRQVSGGDAQPFPQKQYKPWQGMAVSAGPGYGIVNMNPPGGVTGVKVEKSADEKLYALKEQYNMQVDAQNRINENAMKSMGPAIQERNQLMDKQLEALNKLRGQGGSGGSINRPSAQQTSGGGPPNPNPIRQIDGGGTRTYTDVPSMYGGGVYGGSKGGNRYYSNQPVGDPAKMSLSEMLLAGLLDTMNTDPDHNLFNM